LLQRRREMIRTSAHLYQRLWANLPRVAPLVLVAMLLVGMLVPVYADEVGWRLQERAGIDGVDKLYSEQCGPNTLAAPPWFMLPVRFYSSFFNQLLPDPFWLRVSGVAYAVVWVALLLLLIRRVTGAERRSTLSGLGCGLMGLGVMPWLLVWSRPEQPIILAATAGLLIALGGARTQRWGPMLIALLATVALSYHFKALVLMPLFIACIAATAPLRAAWWNRGLAIAAVGAMAMVGARYWFARLSCPDDVLLAAAGLKQNISLQLLTGSGSWFSAPLRLIANYNLPAYVTQAAPDITPMSNWLPAHLVTKPVQIGWCVAMILAWTAGYGLTVWALIDAARRRVRDARPWLALVVLGCASVWCVGQVVRNVYEASFVLPLLTLAMVLALSTPGLPARLEAATRGTARAIALALPLSALSGAGDLWAIAGRWFGTRRLSARAPLFAGHCRLSRLAHADFGRGTAVRHQARNGARPADRRCHLFRADEQPPARGQDQRARTALAREPDRSDRLSQGARLLRHRGQLRHPARGSPAQGAATGRFLLPRACPMVRGLRNAPHRPYGRTMMGRIAGI